MTASVLNHPLLLAESTTKTLPEPLENFIKNCNFAEFSSSQDCRVSILAALIYYVTIESGFIPLEEAGKLEIHSSTSIKDENNEMSNSAKRQKSLGQVKWGFDIDNVRVYGQLPADFKRQTHYRVNLHLENSSVKCVLLMMRTGEGLMTTLTSEPYLGGSVLLSASRFVPYVNKQNLASSFRYLNELSNLVKDKLCVPLLNQILTDNNQIIPGLLGLPDIDNIIALLSPPSRKNLSLTCRKLHEEVRGYLRRHRKK